MLFKKKLVVAKKQIKTITYAAFLDYTSTKTVLYSFVYMNLQMALTVKKY